MTSTRRRQGRILLVSLVFAALQLVWISPANAEAAPEMEIIGASDLDPAGEKITVNGSGFQAEIPLFVVACDPAVPSGGACDMANFGQATTDTAGKFTIELKVVSSFGTTDCLKTRCSVMTSKVGDGGERSQESEVPIAFQGGIALPEESASPSGVSSSTPDDTADASLESAHDDTSSSVPPLLAGGVVLVLLAGGGTLYLRRTKSEA